MSLFRSILQSRPLQRADYDLPLYRTYQEPEAFPPAPISTSVYMPHTSPTQRQNSPAGHLTSYDLVLLQRRERYYQQKLQDLLDAQSDGLMAGLGGTADYEEESLDTPTQTTYSLRSNSASPARQPRRKKRGLGAARRGIWKTVMDCAAMKAEEDALLKQELRDDQAVLQRLEAWTSKEEGLQQKIAAIEGEDTSTRSQALREEASRLESEIQEMEVRLAQMKTRHRQLVDEIANVDNSMRSKLSSYKTSLAMLHQDVQGFLASPPVSDVRYNADSAFLSLPAKRRTLDMAKEHWKSDIEELKKQRRTARRDRGALEDGAAVWKDVVSEVTDFERFLREETSKLSQAPAATGKGKGKAPAASATSTEILEKMDSMSRSIEEKLDLAHKKQWRLLEVCIEAELQALHQGKEMLEKTFGLAEEPKDSGRDEESESEQPSTQGSSTRDLFASAAEGLSNGPLSHSAALRKSMYEHDEPDPELLFTRPSDDTE